MGKTPCKGRKNRLRNRTLEEVYPSRGFRVIPFRVPLRFSLHYTPGSRVFPTRIRSENIRTPNGYFRNWYHSRRRLRLRCVYIGALLLKCSRDRGPYTRLLTAKKMRLEVADKKSIARCALGGKRMHSVRPGMTPPCVVTQDPPTLQGGTLKARVRQSFSSSLR